MENLRKTHVFRVNQWKTLGTHAFSVGTYGNIRKTQNVRGNLWKTLGKHTLSVRTYEINTKTQFFCGNQLKTIRNMFFSAVWSSHQTQTNVPILI